MRAVVGSNGAHMLWGLGDPVALPQGWGDGSAWRYGGGSSRSSRPGAGRPTTTRSVGDRRHGTALRGSARVGRGGGCRGADRTRRALLVRSRRSAGRPRCGVLVPASGRASLCSRTGLPGRHVRERFGGPAGPRRRGPMVPPRCRAGRRRRAGRTRLHVQDGSWSPAGLRRSRPLVPTLRRTGAMPGGRATSATCTSGVSACVAIDWKPRGCTGWRPTRALSTHRWRSIVFGELDAAKHDGCEARETWWSLERSGRGSAADAACRRAGVNRKGGSDNAVSVNVDQAVIVDGARAGLAGCA